MDKTVDIRVRAHVEPVVEGGSRVQLNQSDWTDSAHYHEESFSPKLKRNASPHTSEFDKIRARAEDAFRQYVSEANQYTTSGRETERYVKSKTNRDLTSSELDFNRKIVDTARDLRTGKITSKEADETVRIARETYNEDRVHTRILKDLLETLKSTSKDEIIENSKVVQDNLSRSKTLGVVGAKGDELNILKERFQKDEIGEEKVLRKFGIGRYANMAMGVGSGLAAGDIGGVAAMGGRSALGAMGEVGLAGGLALGATALVLGTVAAAFTANKELPEKMRSYMMATQSGVLNNEKDFSRFGSAFKGSTMTTLEGMSFYGDMMRSSGGRQMNDNEIGGYTGLTRSRAVSPELLNGIISNQRYSSGGDAMGVATTLESALEKMYPKSFRDKLVQLPEMMGVYNSLAHQMIQTTGYVNSGALSSFVGGIGKGFGVEGENLQRYASGMLRGFSESSNPYIKKFQFAALRAAHPEGLNYQRSLEILQHPEGDIPYLRNMNKMMRSQGLTQYRGWFNTMGLGAEEAGKAFNSNSFEKALELMKSGKGNKPSTEADFVKYMEAQKDYFSAAEVQTKEITEGVTVIAQALSHGYQITFTPAGGKGTFPVNVDPKTLTPAQFRARSNFYFGI